MLSERMERLAMDLKALAGSTPPATWERLRPLALEAEDLAQETARVEELERAVLQGAAEEATHAQARQARHQVV